MGGGADMTDCDQIQEDLVDYITHNLEQNKIESVIRHLAICKACRDEMRMLLEIKNYAKRNITDMPEEIQNAAFDLIRSKSDETRKTTNELDLFFIIQDLFGYVWSPVSKTIQIINQRI
jgi:anti-sigma factor RsiW